MLAVPAAEAFGQLGVPLTVPRDRPPGDHGDRRLHAGGAGTGGWRQRLAAGRCHPARVPPSVSLLGACARQARVQHILRRAEPPGDGRWRRRAGAARGPVRG
eukprot:3068776-Prymnesium_polylepis.1